MAEDIDAAPAAPADEPEATVSREAYLAMKKALELKSAEVADARARGAVFEERERQRIGSWQDDVVALYNMFSKCDDPEICADIAPLEAWTAEFSKKEDIIAQRPLARIMSEAHKSLKRSREEASANSEAAVSLSKAMKELEELKGERDSLKAKVEEFSKLADERQAGMQTLQTELAKAGLLNDKHDFSKVLNREKPAADAAEAVSQMSEKSAGKQPVGIVQSAMAASRASANPLETDSLMAFCNNSSGGLRMHRSNTSHERLGSNGADGSDLASLIRAR